MARTSRSARRTTDHNEIRQWVESHGGNPAAVKRTGGGDDPGILRIDFPGFSGEGSLEPITWETFFEYFETNGLAFLYQDVENSRFSKLVRRSGADEPEAGDSSAGGAQEMEEEESREQPISAIALLEEQHRDVRGLFERYNAARDGVAEKQSIFERIADELAAHSEIEEKIFYPAVLADRTEEELREAVEEHLAVKRLLADMLAMRPDDPQFDGKMKVVQDLVIHHVAEEESKLFDVVQHLEGGSLQALGEIMKSAYDAMIGKQPRTNLPKETKSAAPLS